MAMRQDASTGKMVDVPEEAGQAEANSKVPTMSIKVYAPFKVFYEGEGVSISAVNETGPFDILPHHHNFLCMLIACDLVIKTPFDQKVVKVSRALMHVKADRVVVFVDV